MNAAAKVIITSSSDKKLSEVRSLLRPLIRPNAPSDVLQTINYKSIPDWDKEVSNLTDGKKVDFVIEISGKVTLPKSIRSTRSGGLVAISGYLGDYSEMDPKVNEEGTLVVNHRVQRLISRVRIDIAKTLLYSAVNARGNFVGK